MLSSKCKKENTRESCFKFSKEVNLKKRVSIGSTSAYRLINKAYYLAVLFTNSLGRSEFFKSLSMQFVWSLSIKTLDMIFYVERKIFSPFQRGSRTHTDLNFFLLCALNTFVLVPWFQAIDVCTYFYIFFFPLLTIVPLQKFVLK